MLRIRSSSPSPDSGLSDAEKITLYIVATVAAIMAFLGIAIGILRSRHMKTCKRQARARSMSILKDLPIVQYESSDASEKSADMEKPTTGLSNSTCPICTEDFVRSQILRILPCQHQYHVECIQDWLTRGSSCPICRVDLRPHTQDKPQDKVDLEQGLPDGRARSAPKPVHRVLRYFHDPGLRQNYNSA